MVNKDGYKYGDGDNTYLTIQYLTLKVDLSTLIYLMLLLIMYHGQVYNVRTCNIIIFVQ